MYVYVLCMWHMWLVHVMCMGVCKVRVCVGGNVCLCGNIYIYIYIYDINIHKETYTHMCVHISLTHRKRILFKSTHTRVRYFSFI